MENGSHYRLFGLIGYPLGHSFSKKYFTQKYERENINDCRYELFPLEDISQFSGLIDSQPSLAGLNVTIPYKETVIPYLHHLDSAAQSIGAVNTIFKAQGKLIGFNTDSIGFEQSLESLSFDWRDARALVLGTGGAAKAVMYVLKKENIPFKIVSRTPKEENLAYEQIDQNTIEEHALIINTSPVGMFPQTEACPAIPYQYINEKHLLYDLIYNPEETTFLHRGKQKGAQTVNGLAMLQLQAEAAWAIWNGL